MNYSIAITDELNQAFLNHLVRKDYQEDLCFALYNLSVGKDRTTALIKDCILPETGDRILQGNVAFTPQFLDRVTTTALEQKMGVCFIHSHIGPGWQGMSPDDVEAEEMLAPRIKATTGMPLIGMTVGRDGYWSARFWIKSAPRTYDRKWCESIRVMGSGLKTYFNDHLLPAPPQGEQFTRTISSWGVVNQQKIMRYKIGIIGLGSVGSIVAEALMRIGVRYITLIDFDLIEKKNLDRILYSTVDDIGRHKVHVIADALSKYSVTPDLTINRVPYSIAEAAGFEAALDCDLLFSSVDRPWPRFIANMISYAHLIPVIDGGIDASLNKDKNNLGQARWRTHTVNPGRRCLKCLGQYKSENVALEQSGLLDDPAYISGLPKNHFVNRGENVFGFSLGLAAMEIQQFLSFLLQPRGIYYGPKEFDFNTGNIDFDFPIMCEKNCEFPDITATGDPNNHTLIQEHPIAQQMRREARDET